MKSIVEFLKSIFKSKTKIAVLIIMLVVSGYFVYTKISSQNQAPTYQTAQAQTGTLINTITATGTITSANNVNITIQASGVVKEVLVKNGDKVTQGQTIATLTLDQASQQKAAGAYASYLSARNSLDNANAKYNSLQNTLFVANQKLINDAVARGLLTSDPTYIEENATWLQAESDYKNQATAILAAQSSLTAASLNLSQTSSTITAPASGIIKGLTITPGAIVTVTSSSSNATSTSQVLGSINQEGSILAQVNISEIDSVKALEGQKATLTLDSFPGVTFTGKVVSINTNGVVSSGVSTYPAVISFDSGNDHIYPNMAVSAKIITSVKNDVVLVPNAALSTGANGSSVRVLKNKKVITVNVTVGDSNEMETEISSGISDGDIVVTGVVNASSKAASTNTSSPFGAIRGGFGGGGGGIRVGGGRGG